MWTTLHATPFQPHQGSPSTRAQASASTPCNVTSSLAQLTATTVLSRPSLPPIGHLVAHMRWQPPTRRLCLEGDHNACTPSNRKPVSRELPFPGFKPPPFTIICVLTLLPCTSVSPHSFPLGAADVAILMCLRLPCSSPRILFCEPSQGAPTGAWRRVVVFSLIR
jgi:hypothetical protein